VNSILNWFKKLHWLYKLGIALSLAYFVFASIHSYKDIVHSADEFADVSLRTCIGNKGADCALERAKNYALFTENMPSRILAESLLPIPFYWLFATIGIYFFKILRTGYKAEIHWLELSRAKKLYAGLCFLVFFLSLLILVLWIFGLKKELKTPVHISSLATVFKYPQTNPSSVTVKGTWLPDHTPRQMSWDVIQTSEIYCSKELNACHEAIAYVSNNTNSMESELKEFRILKWTDTSIVSIREGLCFNHILTIDLVTEKANSIIKSTGDTKCDPVEEMSFSMVNGWDVYWKEYNSKGLW